MRGVGEQGRKRQHQAQHGDGDEHERAERRREDPEGDRRERPQRPGGRKREHGAQVEVLDVVDVVGEQAERISDAVRRAPEDAAFLHGAEQLRAQARRDAQHPVVAGQALVVGEERLADAKDLHEPQRDEQAEQSLERLFGGVADEIARHEHEPDGKQEGGDAQPERREKRLSVLAKERPDPAVLAPQALQTPKSRLALIHRDLPVLRRQAG